MIGKLVPLLEVIAIFGWELISINVSGQHFTVTSTTHDGCVVDRSIKVGWRVVIGVSGLGDDGGAVGCALFSVDGLNVRLCVCCYEVKGEE